MLTAMARSTIKFLKQQGQFNTRIANLVGCDVGTDEVRFEAQTAMSRGSLAFRLSFSTGKPFSQVL